MTTVPHGNNELYLAPMRNGRLLGQRIRNNGGYYEDTTTCHKRICHKEQIIRHYSNNNIIPNNGWIPLKLSEEDILRVNGNVPFQRHPCYSDRAHHRDDDGHGQKENERVTPSSIILGRADFLMSLFAGCGCSTNTHSSKNKCHECRMVMSWAGNLSRQMVKIESYKEVSGISCHRLAIRCEEKMMLSSVTIVESSPPAGSVISPSSRSSMMGPTANDDATTADVIQQIHSSYDENTILDENNIVSVDPDIKMMMMKKKNLPLDIDRQLVVDDPKEWRNRRTKLSRGMRILLRFEGEHLDFLVASHEDWDSFHDGSGGESNNVDNDDDVVVDKATSRTEAALRNHAFTHNQHDDDDDDGIDHEWRVTTAASGQLLNQSCWLHPHQPIRSMVPKNNPTTIWFCPRGQDLPRKRIEILTKRLNNEPRTGVQVVDDYRAATHWVISGQLSSLLHVSRAVKMSEESLRNYLDSEMTTSGESTSRGVTLVQPRWLDTTEGIFPIPPPSAVDQWYGYSSKSCKERNGDSATGTGRKRKRSGGKESKDSSSVENQQISEWFLRLSKMYEQSPCLPDDEMKARQFHLIAGRLQKIHLEITKDTPLRVIRSIPIIGLSTAVMIKEIVETGRLQRLEGMKGDPIRIALRNLTAIWGVGPATAMTLIRGGYMDIRQVRDGIHTEALTSFLTRRQRIGVDCYEDFLDDMTRVEVETMFESIKTEAQKILPGCEAEIMGSYRRGKDQLGDLDVLIVSNEYQHTVPSSAMTELVNGLTRQGYVAHHLTYLPGLICTMSDGSGYFPFDDGTHEVETSSSISGMSLSTTDVPQPSHDPQPSGAISRSFKNNKNKKMSRSASYMGVFYSPTCGGKRRRVDIKIWPYCQRPYATLYFTGGKYFNRSMRQWAKAKFNWRLNDKGIFDIGSGQRVHPTVQTEEDVFDVLQLIYKAPPERKFFDDVHPISDF